MMWLVLCWFLLSVPLSVVVGRCIAAGQTGAGAPHGAVGAPRRASARGAVQPLRPAVVLAGRR